MIKILKKKLYKVRRREKVNFPNKVWISKSRKIILLNIIRTRSNLAFYLNRRVKGGIFFSLTTRTIINYPRWIRINSFSIERLCYYFIYALKISPNRIFKKFKFLIIFRGPFLFRQFFNFIRILKKRRVKIIGYLTLGTPTHNGCDLPKRKHAKWSRNKFKSKFGWTQFAQKHKKVYFKK